MNKIHDMYGLSCVSYIVLVENKNKIVMKNINILVKYGVVIVLLMFVIGTFNVNSQSVYYLDYTDTYALGFDEGGGNQSVEFSGRTVNYYNSKQQLEYKFEKNGISPTTLNNTYYTYYEYNVNGSLKSMSYFRWYTTSPEKGSGYWRDQTRNEYTYLANGKLDKDIQRKYEFSETMGYTSYISSCSTYSYSEDGTLHEIVTEGTYGEGEPLQMRNVMKYLNYNDNGLVGRIEKWTPKYGTDENELVYATVFEYNDDGTVATKSELSNAQKERSKSVFTYTATKKVATEIEYADLMNTGTLKETLKKVFAYDANDNLIKEEKFPRNSASTDWDKKSIGYSQSVFSSEGHQESYVPTGVLLNANGAAFTMTWTAPVAGGKLGYNVYMNGIKLNNEPITSATYTHNSTYHEDAFCFVTQVYAVGKESSISNVVTKTRADCNNSVKNVAATFTVKVNALKDEVATVNLTWSVPSDNTGLEGYNVYSNGVKKNNMKVEPQTTSYVFDVADAGANLMEVYAVYSNNCTPVPGTYTADIELKKHNAPSDFTVTQIPGVLACKLEWNHTTDFSETFLGFCLNRNTNEILIPEANLTKSATYIDMTPASGGYYTYNVGAKFSDVSSIFYSSKSITMTAGAPAGLVDVILNDSRFGTVRGGGEVVAAGSKIELVATPSSGYEFKNWSIDGNVVSVEKELSHTVKVGRQTVYANFDKIKTGYCVDEVIISSRPDPINSKVEVNGREIYFHNSNIDLDYKKFESKSETGFGPSQLYTYKYDDSGNIKTEIKADFQPESSLWLDKYKTTWNYINGGRIENTRIEQYNANGEIYIVEESLYAYDAETARLSTITVRQSHSGAPFKVYSEERYVSYNEDGQPLKIEKWYSVEDVDMRKTMEYDFEYNEDGSVEKRIELLVNWQTSELEIDAIYTYDYDPNGQVSLILKEGRAFPTDPLIEQRKTEYKYDAQNNLVECAVYVKESSKWMLFEKSEYKVSVDRHQPTFVPQNLTSTSEGTNVVLTWTEAETNQSVGYNVYKNALKLNATPVTLNTYTCQSEIFGNDSYFVTQILTSGEESDISNSIFLTKPECSATVALTGVDYTITTDAMNNNNEIAKVVVTWTAPTAKANVVGYDVYVNGAKSNLDIIPEDTKTYSVDITKTGEYTFNVAAVYDDNCQPKLSEPIVKQITAREHALPSVSATQIIDKLAVQITWSHVTDFEDKIDGYYVMRDGVDISGKATLIVGKTSFVDINVVVGTQYSYSVAAVFSDVPNPVVGYSSVYPIITAGTEVGIVNVTSANPEGISVTGGGMYDVDERVELIATPLVSDPIIVDWSINGEVKYSGLTYNYKVKHEVVDITANVRLVSVDEVRGIDVTVYPNPVVDGKLFVDGACSMIQIFDIMGRLRFDKTVFADDCYSEIDVKQLNKGTYVVKVFDENNKMQVYKIVIK